MLITDPVHLEMVRLLQVSDREQNQKNKQIKKRSVILLLSMHEFCKESAIKN